MAEIVAMPKLAKAMKRENIVTVRLVMECE
jgi:hypothetical protein